ncbi:DNA polymerase [Enterococcus gallinarum]|uniref:DNA polymerase n=1 Tax=Enterococcus gallinarum TaxID=1353 RepID=UPI001BCA9F41|nr:DNA polymerase [Enterococcus gallinarum]
MKHLSLDLETYSSVDISKCGVYKYSESPDFEIMLFAYSADGHPVEVIDLTQGEQIPREVVTALSDETVIKHAFNANFERVCLSRFLGGDGFLSPRGWHCTMVWGATLGLPLSLAGVGAVLGLDKQKLSEGKDLIRYFCVPCSPTKTNGGRTRNLPRQAPDKWIAFKEYNTRDVDVELAIQDKLSKFPVPDEIWEEYCFDQEINDRGIEIDMILADSAMRLDELSKNEINDKLKELTGIENPNSVLQMRGWLNDHGLEVESLGKAAITDLLSTTCDASLKDVLLLRQQLAKSSVRKYQAMQNFACSDNRARGLFQFYGANRTGRFAGRGIQLQNLPQNHMEDLEEARGLVRQGDFNSLSVLYDSVPNVLSELIRTAFVPRDGMKFIVSDFSAIEARVIAWLAGEKWRQEVFKNGGDIYCASASQMFGVPVEKHGVNGHLRQKGKISELALGYGGSVGALKAMGALNMGLTEDELQPLVNSWRDSNPAITRLWWDVDRAVKDCIKQRSKTETHGIKFEYKSGFLFIHLLSGRKLAYVKPAMGENRFGGKSVTYEGVGATKKWERLESYGPKFVENIVQAMARDILCFAMSNLRQFDIVGSVHDEVIIEVQQEVTVEEINSIMAQVPLWADGLLLNADGYECQFYKKD